MAAGSAQRWLCSILCAGAFACVASAAGYPERAVRVIVPFATGGGTDIMGRVLSERLTVSLGRSFVVENRPGGGAMVGAEMVAKATPDGYTLLLGTSAELTISPSLYGREPYSPTADFWPIALLGVSPVVAIAHPRFPGKDLRDLIAMAKASPGKLSFATGGTGTNPHLSGELFKTLAGVDMVHIPYKGGGPAQIAIVGGEVEIVFTTFASTAAHLKSKQVKPLAIISTRRSALLPDVPSAAEQGLPNFEGATWFGLFVPSQAPKEVSEVLRGAVDRALRDRDMQTRLEGLGIEAGSVEQGGEALQTRIRAESATWSRVIRDARIRAD